ncbi:MAG: response regulator [bacterium]|nr:response regulator [bacterium]
MKKILIVEDDYVNRIMLDITLTKTGYSVDCAANGIEAVCCFRDKKYDAVLMDIQLPGMDGIETMQEIKKISRETPVIAVTGYAHKSARKNFLREGFDEYIAKPYKFSTLKKILISFLFESPVLL